MKATRRDSRETAFALVFEWSFHENLLDEMIESATAARDLAIDDFAYQLAKKTTDYYLQIDQLIEAQSDRWKIGRISRVTLAALRIAFCELEYFDDIPAGATVNEAVELVKKYGTQDEAAYLNGMLGAYLRNKETPAAE